MNFAKIFGGTNTPIGREIRKQEQAPARKQFEAGNATRVISGYYSQAVGPDGSTKVPIYNYIPNGPTAAAGDGGNGGSDDYSYGTARTVQGKSTINFAQQLADIKAQNQASIDDLTKQLTDQKTDYDARELAANAKISNLSSTVANAQSQYDPTKGLQSSNNINPALTIQEKNKSLSSGTQRYNRSKLSINNLNV